MKAWEDLVATSLVGTGRAQVPALSPGTPALDAVLQVLDRSQAERYLLQAAAIVATWRAAGSAGRPVPFEILQPTPASDCRECPPAAASHLARMLQDQDYRPVLPEWLAAVHASELCLPHAWLPEMLDLASENSELRALILPVIGARGAWLAGLNPEWSHLLTSMEREAVLERWATAAFAERLNLLRSLRLTDPALGRELLTSTWVQEPHREREAFLLALATNLSLDDEPFLEAALDDRRKEVRAAAAELLASLPGSRLSERMLERLHPVLEYQPGEKPSLRNFGRGKPAQISVVLPEACDKGMERDGVRPKPGAHGHMGERAWWLVEMLGAIPPRTWCEAWHTSPAELAAAEGGWREPLWSGWAMAARRHRDAEWAAALVSAAFGRFNALRGTKATDAAIEMAQIRLMIDSLWPVLSPEIQESFILQVFRDENELLRDEGSTGYLLALTRGVWSETMGRAILRSLQRRIQKGNSAPGSDWLLRSWLKQFALSMPPSLAPEAAAGWVQGSPTWDNWVEPVSAFMAVLQFRHDMHAALRAVALAGDSARAAH